MTSANRGAMKTLDELMQHLCDNGIACSGELQKRELKNLGYYHGYKGYRFAGIAKNRLHLQSFEQISSLNSFDMALKSLIYPRIIAVETALKNYTLEEVLQDAESPFLDQIFAQSLNAYKEYRGAKKQYKIKLLRRLRLRNEMDSLLSQRYKSSVPVIQHFFDADKQVPIWSIFEVITLGTFGAFYKCLDARVKQAIVQELNRPSNFNSASLLGDIIFTLKDLRNAVAHNGIVVGVRFKSNSVNQGIGRLINGDSNNRHQFQRNNRLHCIDGLFVDETSICKGRQNQISR